MKKTTNTTKTAKEISRDFVKGLTEDAQLDLFEALLDEAGVKDRFFRLEFVNGLSEGVQNDLFEALLNAGVGDRFFELDEEQCLDPYAEESWEEALEKFAPAPKLEVVIEDFAVWENREAKRDRIYELSRTLPNIDKYHGMHDQYADQHLRKYVAKSTPVVACRFMR